jgi:hypothetical protein
VGVAALGDGLGAVMWLASVPDGSAGSCKSPVMVAVANRQASFHNVA